MMIANNAPTIDVFGATPVRTISSRPMIAPRILITIFRIRIYGEYALGCSDALMHLCVILLCVTNHVNSSISYKYMRSYPVDSRPEYKISRCRNAYIGFTYDVLHYITLIR